MGIRNSVVAIIPARAGSKGLPGKNKAVIDGVPLIEYTIRALEAAKSLNGILLTTDDEYILARYRTRNSILLVERPAALAKDGSKSEEAVAHALEIWSASGKPDPEIMLIAQPTTPLRTAADIEAAIELMRFGDANSLVSVCRVEGNRHPREMYRSTNAFRGSLLIPEDPRPRQSYETLFHRNGAIYLVKTDYFRRTSRLMSPTPLLFEMPWERSVNIDAYGDFVIAKALIESGLLLKDQ